VKDFLDAFLKQGLEFPSMSDGIHYNVDV